MIIKGQFSETRNKSRAVQCFALHATSVLFCFILFVLKPSLAISQDALLDCRTLFERHQSDLESNHAAQSSQRILSYQSLVAELQRCLDQGIYAQALIALAVSYQEANQWEDALKHLSQAQDVYRSTASDSGLYFVNLEMALIYQRQRQPEKAKPMLFKSLEHARNIDDTMSMGRSLNILGSIYAMADSLEQASEFFRQSMELWQQTGNKSKLAASFNNLGNVYSALGKREQAEEYYLTSIDLKKDLQDFEGLANSYNNLGDFYFNAEAYNRAIAFFQKSANLSDSLEVFGITAIAQQNLAITYEMLGDFESAYHAMWMADSLNTMENAEKYSRDVAELQEQFESVKKDYRISDLEKENQLKALELEQEKNTRWIWALSTLLLLAALVFTVFSVLQHQRTNTQLAQKNEEIDHQRQELAETNEELRETTATKERLFAIIAHNLKGPLSALEGVSGIMDHYLKKGQTDKLRYIATEVDNTAFQTNALIANLLNWSRTKTRNIPHRPERIELSGALAQCIDLVKGQARQKGVKLGLKLEEECAVEADLNVLKTLMTNLLHNAIKFTPTDGMVKVEVEPGEDRVSIAVRDTGVGIAPERLPELFGASASKSTYGTGGEQGTGLGLYVCQEFARMEGGELTVESTLGKGSVFRFSLALAQPQASDTQPLKSTLS